MMIAVTIIVIGYLLVTGHGALTDQQSNLFKSGIWLLSSLLAATACLGASLPKSAHDRTAWLLMSLGCVLWSSGHLIWSYLTLVSGKNLPTTHWSQAFFIGYPVVFVLGLLRLPKPPGAPTFSFRHVGNLSLIVCTLTVCFAITLLEPTQLPAGSLHWTLIAILKASGLAAICMTALYLLWSYPWRSTYMPLLMIALGSGVQTAMYVTHVHLRMTDDYSSESWHNISWLLGFGAIACAAYERAWQRSRPSQWTSGVLLTRERWLKAAVPASLIVVMLTTAWLNTRWLTPRVATFATAAAIVFAFVLSMRDAWIQREEQQLLSALNESNDKLLTANRELAVSEQRFRSLNADLEKRVVERTTELQSAYRELEGFSYAVAHDIKAPLRAVNSFAALLLQEHGKQLDEKALEYVERMRRGALHMAQLVEDLLAYARVERLELKAQSTDLRASFERCLAEQRDEISRLGAAVSLEMDSVAAHVDDAAFTLTVRNLLQNALKFSSRATPPRIDIQSQRLTDRIRITVADNGIGFDMQYHDRIFALFQRLHRSDEYPGTGIGLAIARKAIERMGGRMWAQSAVGEGATFFIELPLTA